MGVFFTVAGVKGDSQHTGHEDWIVAENCTIPTTRPETQTGMGKVTDRTRTNVDFEDIQVKKSMDLSSPGLIFPQPPWSIPYQRWRRQSHGSDAGCDQ